MTNNELFTVMRQIVMLATGLDGDHVVIMDSNIGAPDGEYCSVAVYGSSVMHGKGGYTVENIGPVSSPIGNVFDVKQTIRQRVLRSVALNFYRGNANDHAIKMLGAGKRFDVHGILITEGIGWISTGPVNDLSALQSNRHEQRAEVTVTIATLETQEVISNAIYQVPTTVQDGTSQLIESTTISAPPE